MKYMQSLMHARALALVLGCLLGSSALADENPKLPAVFTFSAGYKTDAPEPENVVELGVIKKCGKDAWCLDLDRYDSAKMLPRVPTRYFHNMHAPYGNGTCLNGPVMTYKGTIDAGIKVAFQPTADGFSVAWGDFRYRWVADPKVRDGYTVAEISYKQAPLEQAVGFAFASDREIRGDLTKADLAYYYKGEIYHKTALTRVDGAWSYSGSSFDFRPYDEADNGKLLLRTLPGDASVVKKYGKPMWVQSSIVLARGGNSLAPIIQEYGHDFTMDGCFNEFGHNKMMLPAGRDGVTALIYVEYTPDKERGFPMLSVGRYYR
jgi:hypothetical protein